MVNSVRAEGSRARVTLVPPRAASERLAVLEEVASRTDRRVDDLSKRAHDQATALQTLVGNIELISQTVDRIEANQEANRAALFQRVTDFQSENTKEHAAVRTALSTAVAGFETRIRSLEDDRRERDGAEKVEQKFGDRLGLWGTTLLIAVCTIAASFLGNLANSAAIHIVGK